MPVAHALEIRLQPVHAQARLSTLTPRRSERAAKVPTVRLQRNIRFNADNESTDRNARATPQQAPERSLAIVRVSCATQLYPNLGRSDGLADRGRPLRSKIRLAKNSVLAPIATDESPMTESNGTSLQPLAGNRIRNLIARLRRPILSCGCIWPLRIP